MTLYLITTHSLVLSCREDIWGFTLYFQLFSISFSLDVAISPWINSCLFLSSIPDWCLPWRCLLLTQKLRSSWSISIGWRANLVVSTENDTHLNVYTNLLMLLLLRWESLLKKKIWIPILLICNVSFYVKVFDFKLWHNYVINLVNMEPRVSTRWSPGASCTVLKLYFYLKELTTLWPEWEKSTCVQNVHITK